MFLEQKGPLLVKKLIGLSGILSVVYTETVLGNLWPKLNQNKLNSDSYTTKLVYRRRKDTCVCSLQT